MTLRAKIFIVLGAVIAFYAGFELVVQIALFLPSYERFERAEAKKDLERCTAALQNEINTLDATAFDWASWDQTYAFVETRDPEYIKTNFVQETFIDNNINLIHIYNNDGDLVWGKALDLKNRNEINLADAPGGSISKVTSLFDHDTSVAGVKGLLVTGRGPFIIASRPILTSSNKGPKKGTLIMGRLIDSKMINHISTQTKVTFRLFTRLNRTISEQINRALDGLKKHEVFFDKVDSKLLYVYAMMPDVTGDDEIILRADIPRYITIKGKEAVTFALLSIFAVAGLMLFVIKGLLERFILTPLGRLSSFASSTGEWGEPSTRVDINRKDEFGMVAAELNNMAEQLQKARRRLVDLSFYSGMAEMAAGVLHNIRNVLNPAIVSLERLKEGMFTQTDERLKAALEELRAVKGLSEREADLIEYIALTCRTIDKRKADWISEIELIKKKINHVEAILLDQEQFARAKRPLEEVRLNHVVSDALTLVPLKLSENVRVELDMSLTRVEPVLSHRIVVSQVIGNILLNAAESISKTENGTGVINISARSFSEKDVEFVELIVKDSGTGIETEDLGRIFERGVTSKANGRSGLGLHWSSVSMVALGGRIWAESDGPNEGSRFHIVIPRTPPVGIAEV